MHLDGIRYENASLLWERQIKSDIEHETDPHPPVPFGREFRGWVLQLIDFSAACYEVF